MINHYFRPDLRSEDWCQKDSEEGVGVVLVPFPTGPDTG